MLQLMVEKKDLKFLKKIFDSVIENISDKGKFVFVTSSLSNYEKLIKYAQNLGLKTRILSRKETFF